jgi:hypothetical protein
MAKLVTARLIIVGVWLIIVGVVLLLWRESSDFITISSTGQSIPSSTSDLLQSLAAMLLLGGGVVVSVVAGVQGKLLPTWYMMAVTCIGISFVQQYVAFDAPVPKPAVPLPEDAAVVLAVVSGLAGIVASRAWRKPGMAKLAVAWLITVGLVLLLYGLSVWSLPQSDDATGIAQVLLSLLLVAGSAVAIIVAAAMGVLMPMWCLLAVTCAGLCLLGWHVAAWGFLSIIAWLALAVGSCQAGIIAMRMGIIAIIKKPSPVIRGHSPHM